MIFLWATYLHQSQWRGKKEGQGMTIEGILNIMGGINKYNNPLQIEQENANGVNSALGLTSNRKNTIMKTNVTI